MVEFKDENKIGHDDPAVIKIRRFSDVSGIGKENDELNSDTDTQETKKEKHEIHKELDLDHEKKQELNLGKKASRILCHALAAEIEKKINEKKVMKNAEGNKLLNAELFYMASIFGKDIVEDEEIINEVIPLIKGKEKAILPEVYRNRLKTRANEIADAELNELIFKAFVFRKVEKEIQRLKDAIVKENIYQGRIKEINNETKFVLTEKTLEILKQTSSVEKDFLDIRISNPDRSILHSNQEEILTIIHDIVRAELLIDEVPISLNITNKMETKPEDKIEVTSTDDVEKSDDEVEKVVSNEDLEKAKRLKEMRDGYKKERKLFKDKFEQLKKYAVTDEDVIDLKHAVIPILHEFNILTEKAKDPMADEQELTAALEENKKKIEDALVVFDEMLSQIEEHQDHQVEGELKPEQEIFETAVVMAREVMDEILDAYTGKEYWENRKKKYQDAFLKVELAAFLDDLIDQEKMISDDEKENFIVKVLREIFDKKEDETKVEDQFNAMLNEVK